MLLVLLSSSARACSRGSVDYYNLILVDAPFALILREWQWSSPSATTALFWFLALVGVLLLAFRRCRSRLTVYELAVLAVTFVGAVQAVRGVIWFALACAAILPVALDGLLTKADVNAPKVNRTISLVSLAGLAVAIVAFLAHSASWYVSDWHRRANRGCPQGDARPVDTSLGDRRDGRLALWRLPSSAGASPTTSASSSTTGRCPAPDRPLRHAGAGAGSRISTATGW